MILVRQLKILAFENSNTRRTTSFSPVTEGKEYGPVFCMIALFGNHISRFRRPAKLHGPVDRELSFQKIGSVVQEGLSHGS